MSAPPQPPIDETERIIANEEFYLSAVTKRIGQITTLSVYQALRTEETDSWFRPVLLALDGRCYEWVSSHGFNDEMMMGGYAVQKEYNVFDECPGRGRRHQCAASMRA